MLVSYLNLSFRLLARNPFFALINIVGLSIGFAAFFVLWHYAQGELQSDQFHPHWERIYRFGMNGKWTDDKVNWEESRFAGNDPAFAEQIANQYLSVEAFTRVLVQNNFISTREGFESFVKDHGTEVYFSAQTNADKKSFNETKVVYGDPNLFSFFEIPLIEGDKKNALVLARCVVLSEKTAIKYFGTRQAVGETLLLNDHLQLKVTGVFKDLPRNTHLDFEAVISSENLKTQYSSLSQPFWAPVCYLRLRDNADVSDLQSRINSDLKEQINNIAWRNREGTDAEIYFQALSEMPFLSYRFDFYRTKSKVILSILRYASVAILLLALINYVNLTVSSNRKRLKEVAARKTIGAKPIDFVAQFTIEAMVINTISILLAMTIVQLIKLPMETIFGFYVADWRELSITSLMILLIAFTTGVAFAGLYPAVVSLKGSAGGVVGRRTRQSDHLAGTLFTTFQYTVAIAAVIFVFAVYEQLIFIMNKDIGLDKEQTLVFDLPFNQAGNFKTQLNSLLSELRANKNTTDITVSQSVAGDNTQRYIELNRNESARFVVVECNGGVDENFIPFYKIGILAGRNFFPDSPADSVSILVSESTVRRLGFENSEAAIGEKIMVGNRNEVQIIGVFKDYKLRPLLAEGFQNYGGDPGLAMTYKDFLLPGAPFTQPRRISIRVHPEKFSATIDYVEKKYQQFFPEHAFNWYFLDDAINGKYQEHLMARNQTALFSVLTIGIACLGLLGMISNKVVERTKEIGIRKVLGAKLHQIAQLLLSITLRQIIIAACIGIPIAHYLTQQYLKNYTARVALHWWHYVIPVSMLMGIMFLSISSVLWKAATNNPVDALKHE
jgi:putative ABC transport system permease protein